MILRRLLSGLLLLGWVMTAHAGIYAFEFDDPAKEARFKRLSEELRCLVCQNQTLADSGAGLALDLRKELHQMVLRNASDEEIKTFMVSRYGDFVLYNPPVKSSTYLLWFGPFVLVVIALVILIMAIRRNRERPVKALSPDDLKRAQRLLAGKDKEV
ncbi:MAG: cytochrome c-type biogenesis protein CcmH [Gammaproteobacteria bacterium]|nr:cytochrome c-type biogenesis protein CcmH [Gammaproteobacteria bacterium]MDH5652323.1 cytochrome c-type biogenesis protein CcmH [Gammaproteobacteria bacterium]